jgi:ATP-dependent DNA helicase RecG
MDRPVQFLKGVGPGRARLLARLGITTIADLLSYYPREYDDRRSPLRIGQLAAGQKTTVFGRIEASEQVKLSRDLNVFKVAVSDGTGLVFGLFYRKVNPYHRHDVFTALKNTFQRGCYAYLNGTPETAFGQKQLKIEDYEVVAAEKDPPLHFGKIVPVYPLTEGINQKWLRLLIHVALTQYAAEWPDILPEKLREEKGLIAAVRALNDIHYPADFTAAENARRRLAFDEFLLLEMALTLARQGRREKEKQHQYHIRKELLTPFREKLRFEFTAPQKKVINEIFNDLMASRPMHRLLLGDVGSGKTVVAISAMLLAAENGYQSVLLAPTEILAEQHYLSMQRMLEGLRVKIVLLTGRMSAKKKERRGIIDAIASGEANIIVGTHALFEKDIRFKTLSLAVIDEQHRFGVLQRAAVRGKGEMPDVLVMTATPIPRTLALTLYGDLDISVIDRLPPGRKPIVTLHSAPSEAYALVKREIQSGHQAYIVYPLVEESDKTELKAAVQEAETLSETVFKGFRVALLHGQMPAEEKEKTMECFRNRGADILIATTVIEVGIDVPNATAMVIEHADHFGLATLHQLRGRIGRGADKSYCVLLGAPKNEIAAQRIRAMLTTNDGFRIADEDLALRGPGELFGTAQHGMPQLRAGNLVTDLRIIEQAQALAREIIGRDPRLSQPGYKMLREKLRSVYKGRGKFLETG